eukprot:4257-Heterococcus_DN1.PRE.3
MRYRRTPSTAPLGLGLLMLSGCSSSDSSSSGSSSSSDCVSASASATTGRNTAVSNSSDVLACVNAAVVVSMHKLVHARPAPAAQTDCQLLATAAGDAARSVRSAVIRDCMQ